MPEVWTPDDTSTFILRFGPPAGDSRGLRVAVKDLIDMAGVPTTAGSRAVAEQAVPAVSDAACLAGTRAAAAAGVVYIVGKTNLNELAYGVTGLNPWFGTPLNPVDATRVPGGSSSGSAAAVGAGDADVAFGSDTGGSIRIPAACCGIAGLKTTAGRVPLEGVWALAPSLDTVGPMARDTAGLVAGMRLLEPGFEPAPIPAPVVGRVRLPEAIEMDPLVDAAVDAALTASGIEIRAVDLPGWQDATDAGMTVLGYEAWQADGSLRQRGGLSPEVADRLDAASTLDATLVATARRSGAAWADTELLPALARTPVLALATLRALPPVLDDAARMMHLRLTMPANLAGLPALALPVPTQTGFPASLQLLGAAGAEELLIATAAAIEASLGAPGSTLQAPCR